ncbi:MAG: outer membrane protein assembly factor BamA [Pseudomonadota bacterium]
MVKRAFFTFICLVWPLALNAAGAAPKVAVIPFAVHAEGGQANLGELATGLLNKALEAEGLAVVSKDALTAALRGRPQPPGIDEARQLGRKEGADWVVLGTLTRVGEAISLESRLEDVSGSTTWYSSAEGRGTGQIPDLAGRLAKDMADKLLGRQKVVAVEVKGQRRIEADAIKAQVSTRPGQVLHPEDLKHDLRSVYDMGYFYDVRIDLEDVPGGVKVILTVDERPAISEVVIEGNKAIETQPLREAVDIKSYSILNVRKLRDAVLHLQDLYREKGYYNAKVTYETVDLGDHLARLVFKIDEGEKVMISGIDFTGNEAFTDAKLRGLMETKEKGWFSWLTGSGILKEGALESDQSKIAAFYYNRGYIKAQLGKPEISREGRWIKITIPVSEGPQYKLGNVCLAGELVRPYEELYGILRIPHEAIYNREVIRKDILALTDVYADEGYAFADIAPRVDIREEEKTVDLTFDINKGSKVYFERILISGNAKTRDKVIRRELRVYEGELFSGSGLRLSNTLLQRLQFFEDVTMNTSRGSADNLMNLEVKVKERPTGVFSIGAGYSSVEKIIAMAEIRQDNLFGRGQSLALRAHIGAVSRQYSLSFTEPYLLDSRVSAGFDVYNWELEYIDYTKATQGGGLRFSYPLTDWTTTGISYRYDDSDVTIPEGRKVSAIVDSLKGRTVTSSAATYLKRDSRDRIFDPTHGSVNELNVEYAGLGGDSNFARLTASSGWYYPLWWDIVFFGRGKAGYIKPIGSGDRVLPLYERFYLGGINSVRGFDYYTISPRVQGDYVGGNKMLLFNFELQFPLVKDAGLMGVAFYDAGNAFGVPPSNEGDFDLFDLRDSAGVGFRWFSPIGPLRVEWGRNLHPRPGEKTSNWEFSVGQMF